MGYSLGSYELYGVYRATLTEAIFNGTSTIGWQLLEQY